MLLHIDHRHIFGEEDAEKLSIQNVDIGKFTQKENDIISFLGGYVCSTLARRIRIRRHGKANKIKIAYPFFCKIPYFADSKHIKTSSLLFMLYFF